jgi:putative Ca2+/H+ antiporter (TMEM165/GDT1 family)
MCLQTNTQIHCHNSALVTINKLLSEFNSMSIISPSEVGRLTDLLCVSLTLQKKIYVLLLAATGSFFFISMFLFTIMKWFTKQLLTNPNTLLLKQLHFYK